MAPHKYTALVCPGALYLAVAPPTAAAPEWWAYTVDAFGRLSFERKAAPPPTVAVERALEVDAIYGAFSLLRGHYIALVTRSKPVGAGPYGSTLQRIEAMEWVPLAPRAGRDPLSAEEAADEALFLRLLTGLAGSRSFFYGAGYDLTNTLQRNDGVAAEAGGATGSSTLAHLSPLGFAGAPAPSPALGATVGMPPPPGAGGWIASDERFWWNRAACGELIAAVAGGDAGMECRSRMHVVT